MPVAEVVPRIGAGHAEAEAGRGTGGRDIGRRNRSFLFWSVPDTSVRSVRGGTRPTVPGITEENFDRIKEGISRAEVESILGGPPGDYTTGPTITADSVGGPLLRQASGPEILSAQWTSDTAIVWVLFDTSGLVVAKRLARNTRWKGESLKYP